MLLIATSHQNPEPGVDIPEQAGTGIWRWQALQVVSIFARSETAPTKLLRRISLFA